MLAAALLLTPVQALALNEEVDIPVNIIDSTFPEPGETVPEKTGGDVNADGEINLKDVIILAEYTLNNEKPLADENAADCDGSGRVDLKDAAYLAQRLAGWQNRTPHYNITKALQQDGYYEPLVN